MDFNPIEQTFLRNCTKIITKTLEQPEQVATELKNHLQKELDSQLLQSPFTLDDLPFDAFQHQNPTQSDTDNQAKQNPPKQQTTVLG
jgi:hypothetical protein